MKVSVLHQGLYPTALYSNIHMNAHKYFHRIFVRAHY
jgi:hypothetical protein